MASERELGKVRRREGDKSEVTRSAALIRKAKVKKGRWDK
jgi:hypothetical protein